MKKKKWSPLKRLPNLHSDSTPYNWVLNVFCKSTPLIQVAFKVLWGRAWKAAPVSPHSVSSVVWSLAFTPLLSQYFANPSPRFKIRFDNWQSLGRSWPIKGLPLGLCLSSGLWHAWHCHSKTTGSQDTCQARQRVSSGTRQPGLLPSALIRLVPSDKS